MRDRKAPALLLVAAFILAAVFGALLGWSMFFPCVRSLIFPGGIVVLQKGQWTVEMGEQPLLLLSASCVMMNSSGSGRHAKCPAGAGVHCRSWFFCGGNGMGGAHGCPDIGGTGAAGVLSCIGRLVRVAAWLFWNWIM